MTSPVITRVAWAQLTGRRPRGALANARLAGHGFEVRVPVAAVTTSEGTTGFGHSRVTKTQAQALLGLSLDDTFADDGRIKEAFLHVEYPLWDLAGIHAGVPVYRLAEAINEVSPSTMGERRTVPCYDTSLYIDDLHLADDRAAATLIAGEARDGYARGHHNFKIKVGRGARHMPLEEVTRRDVAVVRAVREAVGPNARIMIDANNGYNLNLAKRVLGETADCKVFWIKEPFHEDGVLYQDLHAWLEQERLHVLIADGEGQASPSLLDWAQQRTVDVINYDIFNPGFTRWLEIGQRLGLWGVRSAPHHYGGHLGNYVSGHLAGAIRGFAFVEWDEASTLGIDASAYVLADGNVTLPATPGFGLGLDESRFARAVEATGFAVAA
jgi:L-alanine-DL-glutamate epimerase-like enolase superfamily enzyme